MDWESFRRWEDGVDGWCQLQRSAFWRGMYSRPKRGMHNQSRVLYFRSDFKGHLAPYRLQHPVIRGRIALHLVRIAGHYYMQRPWTNPSVKLARHYQAVASVVSFPANHDNAVLVKRHVNLPHDF